MSFDLRTHECRQTDPTKMRHLRLLLGSAAITGVVGLQLLATVAAHAQDLQRTAAATSPMWSAEQSSLCEEAIRHAEQAHRLPSGLLASIGKIESGRPVTGSGEVRPWPWAINADGAGLFLESKAAAVVWIELQKSRYRYLDVGCLQVDLTFHRNAFSSVAQAFDPTSNAEFAAGYLMSLYRGKAERNWNVAVGLYHSHSAMLAADYRDRVSEIGARVLRGVLDPVPLYVRAIRQGTVRIPLAFGRSTFINIHRQPAVHRRRFTRCQVARVLGVYLNKAARSACPVPTGRDAPR